MNKLEIKLHKCDNNLYGEYMKSRVVTKPLLEEYRRNFPDFTDHSINHSDTVSFYLSEMLKDDELDNLNTDETYILLMACLLHDIGMTIPKDQVETCIDSQLIDKYLNENPDKTIIDFIRDYHHNLSFALIIKDYKVLKIPSEMYAQAIALVSEAHRKVDLLDYDKYPPKLFVKSGASFVCIPYMGCLIRIADELDITDKRISELVLKYYYPKNVKSIQEIEKHRANILVNFDNENVKITAICYNPYIFDTLIFLYKKIKKEIKYCQKVIQNIRRIDNFIYKLTIRTIERDIKTIGFIPKNINFSFELNNIFNFFIGNNLYSERYVAIREALQNAIVTCRYKKISHLKYSPKIDVILEDDKLIIKDNGLGMNEFIVKEFFSKLASSYYQTQKIKNSFESIAKFGIGIFSYFLICDSLMINTRMKGEKPLRFKIFKNYDLNFYFYDDNFIENEGTELILILNEDIRNQLSFPKLVEIIRCYIRDIEFPIKITSKNNSEIITKENYNLIPENEIFKYIKTTHKDDLNKLTLVSKVLKNKKFRGVLGVILQIDENRDLTFKSIRSLINQYDIRGINLSYKGILVQHDTHRFSIFKYIFGKLNILEFQELNLSRNIFRDRVYLNNVIERFELAILYKISKCWNHIEERERFKKSNLFFYYFLEKNLLEKRSKYLRELLKEIIYVEVFNNNELIYIKLKEFLLKEKKFFIIPIESGNIKKERRKNKILTEIYVKYHIPIILGHYNSFPYIYSLINNDKVNLIIFPDEFRLTLLFFEQKDKKVQKYNINEFELVEFNNSIVTTRFFFTPFLNKNHPIIKFWIKNLSEIKKNDLLKEIFDELSLFFNRFYIHRFEADFFMEINNFLEEINKIYKVNLKLDKDDLPFYLIHPFSSNSLDL